MLAGVLSLYSVPSSSGNILHSGVVTVAKIGEAFFVKPVQIGDTPPNIDESVSRSGDTRTSPFNSHSNMKSAQITLGLWHGRNPIGIIACGHFKVSFDLRCGQMSNIGKFYMPNQFSSRGVSDTCAFNANVRSL